VDKSKCKVISQTEISASNGTTKRVVKRNHVGVIKKEFIELWLESKTEENRKYLFDNSKMTKTMEQPTISKMPYTL